MEKKIADRYNAGKLKMHLVYNLTPFIKQLNWESSSRTKTEIIQKLNLYISNYMYYILENDILISAAQCLNELYNLEPANSDSLMMNVIKVLDMGAKKYSDINWMNGFDSKNLIASYERHKNKYFSGEILDDESNLPHLAHCFVNLAFLYMMHELYPQGDNRSDHKLLHLNKKIGMDIDEVLCDFLGGYCEKYGLDKEKINSWHFDRKFEARYAELCKDKEFWMNLKPLTDSTNWGFEPTCYISSRLIPEEWTAEWLDLHNFPAVKVIHTTNPEGKLTAYRANNLDLFIDDHILNFKSIIDNGGNALLFHANHNARYKVGNRRIHDLGRLFKEK